MTSGHSNGSIFSRREQVFPRHPATPVLYNIILLLHLIYLPSYLQHFPDINHNKAPVLAPSPRHFFVGARAIKLVL
jgi:hypothetical protein